MDKVTQDLQPGLGTLNIVGNLTFLKLGTTARQVTFPDAAITVARSDAAQTFIGTQTFTTVNATTLDTNVAAAGVTLAGTTLAADGTDADISIAITPKGTGSVVQSKVDINGGAIDATVIGGATPAAVSATTVAASGLITGLGTYGGIYLADGATPFNVATGATYVLCTAFNAATGYNGVSNDVTPNKAASKITITRAGIYNIAFRISWTSDKNTTNFRGAVFIGGTESNNIHGAAYAATGANVAEFAAFGNVSVAANTDIDLRIRHDNGATVAITPIYANIVVTRISNVP
jgi:hypothetical protein